MMVLFILHTDYGEVACRKFGAGKRLLIAFHGFSEDGAAFRALGEQLKDSCTLYAVDLPFHGSTRWLDEEYRPAQLAVVVEAILEKEGSRRFEAVGHSLGARLWLHLLPDFRDRMERLCLLAPDGLQTRWLYLVEWLPGGWRRLAIRWARRPGWILALARLLYRLRLIGPFLLRYLEHHLREAGRRRRLLHTWLALSHFRLNGDKGRRLIQQAAVPVLVLLGDKDRLVRPEVIRRRLGGTAGVEILTVDANHRSICRRAAPFLRVAPGGASG
ncbi:MAG: alpha/beta hydrolase [Phaeodactylibacter sp.]|nr:alpha/beta hydrolase [Phaeodactylibacter sp.]